MGRVIDTDAAYAVLTDYYHHTTDTQHAALREALGRVESVDAVPVVRCRDCEHKDRESGFCHGRGWPMQLVPDDGFCDRGEREDHDG